MRSDPWTVGYLLGLGPRCFNNGESTVPAQHGRTGTVQRRVEPCMLLDLLCLDRGPAVGKQAWQCGSTWEHGAWLMGRRSDALL